VTVGGQWIEAATALLQHVARQGDLLDTAAARCATAIERGGLVHLFGCGHSRIPLEEMFPRYASFPGFHPVAELSTTFHTQIVGVNGQRQAMFLERVPGLAEVILSNFRFGPDDVTIVFSVSGRSAVPLEFAAGARRRGMFTIAVTSLLETMAADPDHPTGTRLCDHADLVLDTGTPPGDGLVELEGLDEPVGPGSSLAYVAIVNELKCRTAERLLQRGALPPVLASKTIVGPERATAQFRRAYEDHARRYAAVLATGDEAVLATEGTGR
jgi:uncharacterized phosphosugar-binding protein